MVELGAQHGAPKSKNNPSMAPSRAEPVQEGDVGIHAYASQCDGIGGELKSVPTDFVVTELLQDGQEVSMEPEETEEEAAAEEKAEEDAEDEWDPDVLVRFVLRTRLVLPL